MAGTSDLAVLLRTMRPALHAERYGIVVTEAAVAAFARIVEPEGTTVIATEAALAAAGVAIEQPFARISLSVHSDLAAVGLTAALAAALAGQGISANVVAGYYHDHILVPWDRRDAAMAALRGVSDA